MDISIFSGQADDNTPTAKLNSGSEVFEGAQARRERIRGMLFVSPWLVGLGLFYVFPILASLLMSFTNYQLVSDSGVSTEWVGVDNWRRMFQDARVWNGLWVTIKFAVMFIPMSTLFPLGLAYLLTSERLWGRRFFRVMFYLPSMIPFVASVMVWRFYLNDQTGWISKILGSVGFEAPNLLGSKELILPTLVFIAMWGVGNSIIIFIAALNGVPTQLYEAARIDGANKWRLFRDVTWPMISPITLYNITMSLVALGQYFLVPFVLQGPSGKPEGASQFFTMVFFQETFSFFNGGYGATLAWGMFIVVFSLSVVIFKTAKYWVHYEYEER